jgi:CheY-like chemotaxis protein
MFEGEFNAAPFESSEAMSDLHSKSDQLTVPRNSPLKPMRAFAKSKSKIANLSTSARREPVARERRVNVLIVDDVADVTEMIALLLKHAGYKVMTANSAPMALQLAHKHSFDLIISDIGMPEMNGYELATSLRAQPEYQGIPIIAVTGYSEYDDRGRAVQAGFNAHITKPIDPTRLIDLMNDLLS